MGSRKPRSRGKKPRPPQNLQTLRMGPYVSRGSRLLEARWRSSGQSMGAFARPLGVHRVTMFRWISGISRPEGDNPFKIQKKYGVPAPAWRED